MVLKHEPLKKWWVLTLVTICLVAWCAGTGGAEDAPEILPIHPAPGILPPPSPPKAYILEGTIQRMTAKAMVVSDMTRRFAPDVRYLSAFEGIEASPGEFKAGTRVGFKLNPKKEIVEIWLLK